MNIVTILRNCPAYQRLELLEYCAEQAATTEEVQQILSVFEGDADPIVRHEAVAQLLRIERNRPHLIAPIQELVRVALVKGIQDKSVVVRHEVLETLAYFGDESTLAILQNSIGDTEPDVSSTAKLSYELLSFRLQHNLRACELQNALLARLSVC